MTTAGRNDDDGRPDGPTADDDLPAGASGGGDADAGFDYDDVGYGGYGDYADGSDDDDSAGDYADDGDDDGGDDAADSDDDGDGRAPWYSWERWKYIGGTLFLVLGLSSVGYVLWDIIDLLPKPVTVMAVRAALRESPGRITDVLALSGMISFGPPAGVDLMFGATQAAKNWAGRERKKGKAEGRKEGRVEGIEIGVEIGVEKGRKEGRAEERTEQRTAMQKRLSKFTGQGMTPDEVQQVIDELAGGGARDGQK